VGTFAGIEPLDHSKTPTLERRMSFTYDPTKIATSDPTYISAVRFLVQDTDEATAEVSDEEITALYGQTSADDDQIVRTYATALAVATGLERRYRKQATFSSGGTSVQYGQRAEAWGVMVSEIADALFQATMQAAGGSGGVLVAGRGPLYYDGLLP
jgi:hypothetical protein